MRFKSFFCLIAAAGFSLPSLAADSKSILPPFGPDGSEVTVKAQGSHTLHGWIPKDWNDNTEWAAVTATYAKSEDVPEKGLTALRVKVEKVEEGSQLQLTSYAGLRKYEKGKTYRVAGWIRSPDHLEVNLGARQNGDPYEMYHETTLATTSAWKPFEFTFKPERQIEALIMFCIKETGTVDLAGITVNSVE